MNCPMPLEKLFLELMALSTAGASSSLLTGLDMARHIISKCLIGLDMAIHVSRRRNCASRKLQLADMILGLIWLC